nr:hypothetical protein [Rhodoferax sp. AJA081-3]
MSAKLPASGLTITKTALTSWTIKAIDKATGEEVYLNTVNPTGKSWASEDQALAEIGKLVGDEFSKNFFLEHFNFNAQKVNLTVDGLPDNQSARLLLRELRGFRHVLDAQLTSEGGKYQLQLAEGNASDLVNDGVLKPLNAKLGQTCFALAGSTGADVNVSFLPPAPSRPSVENSMHCHPPACKALPAHVANWPAKPREVRRLLTLQGEGDELGIRQIHRAPKANTPPAAQHNFFAAQQHFGLIGNNHRCAIGALVNQKNLSRRHSMRACWRDALRSAMTMSQLASRPSTMEAWALSTTHARSCRQCSRRNVTTLLVNAKEDVVMVSSSPPCQMTSLTATSSPLPLTDRAAILRVESCSMCAMQATVAPVVMIWPPLARPAIRAATLTVSPNTSLFSSMTGPK